jgi:hypothetical protein
MIEGILANAVGGILSEVLGNVLKQPMKHLFDEHEMQRALSAAVQRAEERFARDYHNTDAELTDALMSQTRFADIPSVRTALKEMLTHPFHDPTQAVATLQRSFSDVLPSRIDRKRVDAAVNTFLHRVSAGSHGILAVFCAARTQQAGRMMSESRHPYRAGEATLD